MRIDLTGHRYGRLEVLRYAGKNKSGQLVWLCICNCGKEKKIPGFHLRRKKDPVVSCGCYHKEMMSKLSPLVNTKHGKHGSRAYISWSSMIQRCTNKRGKDYPRYGGRGIFFQKSWGRFENFYKDMGDPQAGHTLDRINNEKGYTKDNCRWATNKTQANNRRSNRIVTYKGETLSCSDMARKYGINPNTFRHRLDSGYSIKDTIETPIGEINGKIKSK